MNAAWPDDRSENDWYWIRKDGVARLSTRRELSTMKVMREYQEIRGPALALAFPRSHVARGREFSIRTSV